MTDTQATTPSDRTETLREQIRAEVGFVPNILEHMLANPAVVEIYLQGQNALKGGVLSAAAQNAVQLAVSQLNECHYCTKAHSMTSKGAGVPDSDIQRIQNLELPESEDLKGPVWAAHKLHEKNGWLTDSDLADLRAHGVDRDALYEVIGITGIKTITNYINHIEQTQVDEELQG